VQVIPGRSDDARHLRPPTSRGLRHRVSGTGGLRIRSQRGRARTRTPPSQILSILAQVEANPGRRWAANRGVLRPPSPWTAKASLCARPAWGTEKRCYVPVCPRGQTLDRWNPVRRAAEWTACATTPFVPALPPVNVTGATFGLELQEFAAAHIPMPAGVPVSTQTARATQSLISQCPKTTGPRAAVPPRLHVNTRHHSRVAPRRPHVHRTDTTTTVVTAACQARAVRVRVVGELRRQNPDHHAGNAGGACGVGAQPGPESLEAVMIRLRLLVPSRWRDVRR